MATPRQFRRRGRFALITAVFVGALMISGIAFGYVSTDQAAYSPGSAVTISGGNDQTGAPGYVSSGTVNVAASGGNGWSDSCSATVAGDGTWSCQVTLSTDPSVSVGDYTYTATSTDASGNTISESGTFTDGVVSAVTLSGPFASNCSTAQSSFVQGDTVCVGWSASTTGGDSPVGFSLIWYRPDGTIAADDNKSPIVNGDTGTDSYALPSDAQTGTWTVKACKPDPAPCNTGTFLNSVTFTVGAATPPASSAALSCHYHLGLADAGTAYTNASLSNEASVPHNVPQNFLVHCILTVTGTITNVKVQGGVTVSKLSSQPTYAWVAFPAGATDTIAISKNNNVATSAKSTLPTGVYDYEVTISGALWKNAVGSGTTITGGWSAVYTDSTNTAQRSDAPETPLTINVT